MIHHKVAVAFSNGEFKKVYPYLAESAEWIIVGESHFKGKQSIIRNCEQVAAYFNAVKTVFKTMNVIADESRVVVNGTAEFIRNQRRVSFVSACDVYEFNENNEIQMITSYCIQEKL
ncbi:nuclear transport factor 2 family protein [Pseudopedobacter sp.]|uniref:nuclear transport factor 2 family protein n=1 Tax=Pseudopedobacter sp. TaxID=1936787 RepID=UPI0033426275